MHAAVKLGTRKLRQTRQNMQGGQTKQERLQPERPAQEWGVEILSQEYLSIVKKLKETNNSVIGSLTIQQTIAYDMINHLEFASRLVEFFEMSSEAEEVTVSTVMVLLNVMPHDSQFRARFIKSKGKYLSVYLF